MGVRALKRLLPVAAAFIGGILVIGAWLLRSPGLSRASDTVLNWSVMLGAFAAGIGTLNIVLIHLKKVGERRGGWFLSVILLVAFSVFLVLGLMKGERDPAYTFIWEYVYRSISSTMFAMNAFFIASAAYRSFRIRSVEGAVLALSAVMVMLGRSGIGEIVYSGFPSFADWIMQVPANAGMRGITIAAALGGITSSLRVLLGLSRRELM